MGGRRGKARKERGMSKFQALFASTNEVHLLTSFPHIFSGISILPCVAFLSCSKRGGLKGKQKHANHFPQICFLFLAAFCKRSERKRGFFHPSISIFIKSLKSPVCSARLVYNLFHGCEKNMGECVSNG